MKQIIIAFLLSCVSAVASTGDFLGGYVGTNGWDLYLRFEGISTNGTYNNGFLTNNNPSAPKVTLTLTSQSFTTTKVPTTRSRTIYATKRVRKAWPNNAFPDDTTDGASTWVRVAMSDYVYSGDSNITANILAGFYVNGVSNNAASSVTITNLSQQPYPKVIANWSDTGFRFEPNGTNFTLRAIAFSKWGQSGRQVVGGRAIVTDSLGNSFTNYQTLTFVDTTLSDAQPMSEFIFNFPTNQLASGLLTCNAEFWPWIGDATSVANSADITGQPTPLFAQQTNAINMRVTRAIVSSSGNNATGVAANDVYWATNQSPPAFLTQAGARSAIYGTNSASYGRTNEGAAYLYLASGSHTNLGGTLTLANAPSVELIVEPVPGTARSNVVIAAFLTDARGKDGGDKVRVRNVTIDSADANLWSGVGQVTFDSCDVLNQSSSSIQTAGSNPLVANWLRCSVSNLLQGFKAVSSATPFSAGLVRGNTVVGNVTDTTYNTLCGNTWTTSATTQGRIRNSNVSPQSAPVWGGILYNNAFYRREYLGTILSVGEYYSISNGAVIANNIFEATTNNTASCAFQIATTDVNAFTNVIVLNNSFFGTKSLMFYNDSGSNAYWRVDCSVVNNVYDDYNIKTDDFGGSEDGGRVGNWGEIYGAGYWGNAFLETTSIGAPGSFEGEFYGVWTWGTTTFDTSSTNYPMWLFRKANDAVGSVQAGGGDYRLYSASPLFQRNKTRWALRHDVRGLVRGAGDPPGAERTSVKMEVDQARISALLNGQISP